MGFLKEWRRRRILARTPLSDRLWQRAIARSHLLAHLSDEDRQRLRELVTLFLHDKQIHATGDLQLDDEMRVSIALQACILILNLGLDYYSGWVEIIVYPDEFIPEREVVDEAGVVHIAREPLSGEAWLQGPIILSWADVADAVDGSNVVIHEFAHKIDMLNGDANGFPPLHRHMNRGIWAQAFSAAYEDFCQRSDAGEEIAIDPYAAESPGEFFAVLSEAFFEMPETVRDEYPLVYDQLVQFYRQQPLAGKA